MFTKDYQQDRGLTTNPNGERSRPGLDLTPQCMFPVRLGCVVRFADSITIAVKSLIECTPRLVSFRNRIRLLPELRFSYLVAGLLKHLFCQGNALVRDDKQH